MKNLISQEAYSNALIRLEEIIDLVSDQTPETAPLVQELVSVSDTIEKYEELHFPLDLSISNTQ